MIKILISGLGGALFPHLHEYLKNKYELYYIDSNDLLKNIYPNLNFYTAPLVNNDSYESFIKQLISHQQIDYYIPLIDEEIILAKSKIEGHENVVVISPSVEFAERCLNKYQLMKELKAYNISKIETYLGSDFDWQINAPIFIKPVVGRGSRGIKTINNQKELEAYYLLEDYSREEIMVQPKIEGTEYTIGVTINDLNQILAISSKRVISKQGITRIAVTENIPEIDNLVFDVVKNLEPKGPINIQLLQDNKNNFNIFEINPRFSTTTIMEFEGGVDLISLYIDCAGKKDVKFIKRPKTGINLYRRWETVFYE